MTPSIVYINTYNRFDYNNIGSHLHKFATIAPIYT